MPPFLIINFRISHGKWRLHIIATKGERAKTEDVKSDVELQQHDSKCSINVFSSCLFLHSLPVNSNCNISFLMAASGEEEA